MIYFDHNATTPIDKRVLEAMAPYLTTHFGNPSSLHRLGRACRSAIDLARHQVANFIQTDPANILFTSGGTEANALAIASIPYSSQLAISAIEHPSVFENAYQRKKPTLIIAVDNQGSIDFSDETFLKLKTGDWISVMTANNETGVIQDMPKLADYCIQHGVLLHTDAVQAAGKIPIEFDKSGASMMTLSSHKIYGPKGCGALVHESKALISPLFRGGNQEASLRPGTENVAAIVGFGKAAELAGLEIEERKQHMLSLQSTLEKNLGAIPGITIFSSNTPRISNTTQFSIQDTQGEMLVMQLDKHNIAVSSGSACKEGNNQASPVLKAMSVKMTQNTGAVRVSLGKDNTIEQINEFTSILNTLLTRH